MKLRQLYKKMPQKVEKVVSEIETKTKKVIRVQEVSADALKRKAPAGFNVLQGKFWVQYVENENSLFHITHELLHINRFVNGTPYLIDEWWINNVDNPLEHYAIFPELKEMDLGLDPFKREESDEWNEKNLTLWKGKEMLPLSCSVARMLLTTDSSGYQERAKDLVNKMYPSAWETGENMAKIVRQIGLSSAEEKCDVIRNYLEILGLDFGLQLWEMNVTDEDAEKDFNNRPCCRVRATSIIGKNRKI